ncbi:hypothetical protein VNO80_02872 [Phaseolus coccineus]|uniref:Uncharacterized protein n=1 Tax=Phaseolus coccineus TaxID=3886 RepID=A0AAN9RN64_PHACN
MVRRKDTCRVLKCGACVSRSHSKRFSHCLRHWFGLEWASCSAVGSDLPLCFSRDSHPLCALTIKKVDRDGSLEQINIVPFVDQIFLNEEEAFAFF